MAMSGNDPVDPNSVGEARTGIDAATAAMGRASAPQGSVDAALATLLVSCGDRRGIVAALAQVLAGHGANILDSDQHTDRDAAQFFQRIRFDLADLSTDKLTLERAIGEVAERFKMKSRIEYGDKRQ